MSDHRQITLGLIEVMLLGAFVGGQIGASINQGRVADALEEIAQKMEPAR